MSVDKGWLKKPKGSRDYLLGCKEFVEFAWNHRTIEQGDRIYCPCVQCINKVLLRKDVVENHISRRGILRTYSHWIKHGEVEEANTCTGSAKFDANIDMHRMLEDTFGVPNLVTNGSNVEDEASLDEPSLDRYETTMPNFEEPNEDAKRFYKMLKEAETPLYPGCTKSSKLSFLIRLLHVKCVNGWSNKSFDMLLEVLNDELPDTINIPKNHYESKKQLHDLGMDCIKIDACPNDCMLFWKEDVDKYRCTICGESRWKLTQIQCDVEVDDLTSKSKKKKKAAKVLRYFPLKPRLQRLYMNSKTAEEMRWHDEGRTKDGVLRHPADSKQWQDLDRLYPSFGLEPRNVRLGFATDGFNPFGNMSTSHSTWPVILIPYNQPPWVCMKQPNFIMSLLIPGPSSPGNNIDVYMQPLIEELDCLWLDGAQTFDAYSKQNFHMRVAVLWTINDFPAYGNLSGWSTKGALACPCCHKDTNSKRLQNGNKFCYMAHRRFLSRNHSFRKNKSSFNGYVENGDAPKPLTGNDVLDQLSGYDQITFGKHVEKRGRDCSLLPYNWKKISILFKLPYWKHLNIRHNLDVMHIEKNNCESLVGTLLNIDGKTKDNLKTRKDLELMGIRRSLHPVHKGGDKYVLPPAQYTMSLFEKRKLCQYLQDIKVPDNYSSNISRCVQVKECKIHGLKSHDWHVLMQQILPVAVRGILPKEVTLIVVELSTFFRTLCSKVLRVEELEKLESDIVMTLCKMEMIFPPSFFDVMVHLLVHLPHEAKLTCPVHFRWMYPIERDLFQLKKYVRNKSLPEGSITEGYLFNECLTFCSRYLDDKVETRFNRPGRNDDGGEISEGKLSIFIGPGRALGKLTSRILSTTEWEQARLYVLSNCEEVAPFLEKHKQTIIDSHKGRISVRNVEKIHNETFGEWFEHHVRKMKEEGELVDEQLEKLSFGPTRLVSCFKGYIVNGFRFHTKNLEKRRRTQNSGVFIDANTSSYASAKDTNPVTGCVGYYGVLNEVVVIHYRGGNKIALFKCDWWDVMSRGGIRQDEFGFTTINFTRTLPSNEPFILATQARQVFYLQDNFDKDWRVALKTQPRDFYDMGEANQLVEENANYVGVDASNSIDTIPSVCLCSRTGIEGVAVVADIDKDSQNDATEDVDEDCTVYSDMDHDSNDDNDDELVY